MLMGICCFIAGKVGFGGEESLATRGDILFSQI